MKTNQITENDPIGITEAIKAEYAMLTKGVLSPGGVCAVSRLFPESRKGPRDLDAQGPQQ